MTQAAEPNLLRLTVSGAITGLVAGVVVLGFRWVIEAGQTAFLPEGRIGNYEALPPLLRFSLPVLGGLILGVLFQLLPAAMRQVGIVHVLGHLRRRGGGRLPMSNALIQFAGGAAAVIAGHSVDREGPGVHLGAASGSYLAQKQGASADDDYTLIACGAAASIAAAFNTPLAGALFVIEVLQVRYRITRFMPVILASVIGAVLGRAMYGDAPSFAVPSLNMASLAELPLLGLLGLIIGLLAALFTMLCERIAERTTAWPPALAFTLAGVCTGLLGLWTPQIMGVGYDSLNAMLNGRVELLLVLGIMAFKLTATAVSIGLRVPGGLIGPTLVIGGATGSALGLLLIQWLSFESGSVGFYAVIGMLAMMSATLQAPLAALIALLELTGNHAILLPGMLAVVTADLVARMLLGKDSVFVVLLMLRKSEAQEQEEEQDEPSGKVTPPGSPAARTPAPSKNGQD